MKATSVPPKKSKAARKTVASEDEADESPAFPSVVASDDGEIPNGNENDGDEINTSQTVLLDGKRKRFTPKAEQILNDWLQKNFVVKNEGTLSLKEMHSAYLEMCSSTASSGLDFLHFQRVVSSLFPEGIALADDSPLKDAIHEVKKKKVSSSRPKVVLPFKLKDAIHEAIVDLGNPRKGLRMKVIANKLEARCAGLNLNPNFAKNAIMHELREGRIECVRGVGACGVYRLPRTKEEEEKEIAEEQKSKKKAEEERKKKEEARLKKSKEEDGEKGEGDTNEDTENKDETAAEDEEPANKEVEEGDSKAENEENKEDEKEAAKKRKKKKALKKKRVKIFHGEPHTIEDTFPLAMTYNSEPKEASLIKIRKYLQQHYYGEELNVDRLKKCLQSGCDHGYWVQMSGQMYQLTIEEFDPTADDDMTGQIMNAIVACTEPKISSSILLKKYIIDYHPEFKVLERPLKFKKAIQRGIDKNIIIQLSGIGASGSFRLSSPFTPSPVVLQGKDSASDYEESDDERITGGRGMEIEQFHDAYVPRPTRRRGRAIKSIERFDPSLPNRIYRDSAATKPKGHKKRSLQKKSEKHVASKRGRPSSSHVPAKRPRTKSADSSEEDESESEDEERPPLKSKSRTGAAAAKSKTANKSHTKKKTSESDDEESESEAEVEYTPRKSKSRGGSTKISKKATPSARSSRDQKSKKTHKNEDEGEEDEDNSDSDAKVEYSPRKSTSRGGTAETSSRKTAKPGKASKKTSDSEEDASDKEVVLTPRKPRGTATKTPQETKSSAKKINWGPKSKRISKPQDDDNESESDAEVSRKSSSQRKSTPAAKASKGKTSDNEEDDRSGSDAEVEYTPQKSKSRGGTTKAQPKIGSAKTAKKTESEDEENDSEVEVLPKKRGRPSAQPKTGTAKAAKKTRSDDEEDSEAEVEHTPKKRGRPSVQPKTGSAKAAKKTSSDDEEGDQSGSEAEVEYTPQKSKSRGGATGSAKAAKSEKKSESVGKPRPAGPLSARARARKL